MLHLRRDEVASVEEAHRDVQRALTDDSSDGLVDRLQRYAIELETDHPAMGALIRNVVDELSALGI